MPADTLKSTSITQLDTAWATRDPPSAGFGMPTHLSELEDYVSPTTGGLGNTSSTYKLLRLPSTTVLKSLNLETPAQLDSGSSLLIDVGAYYSDAVDDGTAAANQGVLISANCFLAATAFGQGAAQRLWSLTALSAAKRIQPLWQQVGLTSDPGGYIDIVLAVHTAAGTAVAGSIIAQADIASV